MRLLCILFILFSFSLSAQETRFFMPLEIQQAYEKSTRSYDGKPGSAYWQNTADYNITVTVDPPQRKLTGIEKVTYYNNSPDDLSMLVIRLYSDVYKKGNIRLYAINEQDVSDGVMIHKLTVNGQPYDLQSRAQVNRAGTNLYLRLATPLPSKGKITLDVEWSQLVPLTNRRNGVSDSTSFFVGYWYPQIAVYDDVFGWDQLNYTFRTEMYNNLANFDVTITLPESFCVWATGELQNAGEILPPKVLKRFEEAKTSTETVTVVSKDDLKKYKNKSGTWHFKASEVSDFAFCLSDHYQWDAASLKVGDRKVLINSVYPAESQGEAFGKLTSLQQQSMKFMSEDFPGVEYPYPVFTTYIGLGGGGMEYPMMANNGNPYRGVTVHEMLHTYFPMYVRVNERRFAWMDEGWAQFNTAVLERYYFEKSTEPYYTGLLGANSPMGTISDLPLMTSSQFTDDSNYGYSAYTLPAFIYGMIYDVLGNDMFLKCYREYIHRWAKKSPTPYDFFYTFEQISGQDLSSIWKPWFFEQGYADIHLESLKNGKLTLKNKGNKTVPIVLDVTYADGKTSTIYEKANAWRDGIVTMAVPNAADVKAIKANLSIPDADPKDNFYPSLEAYVSEHALPDVVLGDYAIEGANVVIGIQRGESFYILQAPGGQTLDLIPGDGNRLQTLDNSIKLTFTIEEGKAPVIDLEGVGRPLKATKMNF